MAKRKAGPNWLGKIYDCLGMELKDLILIEIRVKIQETSVCKALLFCSDNLYDAIENASFSSCTIIKKE